MNEDVLKFFDYIVDPELGPSTRLHHVLRMQGRDRLVETTPTPSLLVQ